MLLEVAQKMTLADNLRAIRFADLLLEQKIEGVIETLPMFVSILIHYELALLGPQRAVRGHSSVLAGDGGRRGHRHPFAIDRNSRPLSRPMDRGMRRGLPPTIGEMEDNPEFVARINGLSGPEELVLRHSSTQHWVGGVGFSPGLPDLMPLDPRSMLSVPKYNPPRLWTPRGAIGVGGGFTSIYTTRSPGGYYLIGRTPVAIYSLDTRLGPFRRKATLLAPRTG